MKSLCAFTNILHKNLQQSHNLRQPTDISNSFSRPFDIKYKKFNLMQETSQDVFLGHVGG